MFSNPRVNPRLTQILQVDQDFCEVSDYSLIETRHAPTQEPIRRRRYLEPTVHQTIERDYRGGTTMKGTAARFGDI